MTNTTTAEAPVLRTPVPCPFCGKAFPTNAALYAHTHTAEGTK